MCNCPHEIAFGSEAALQKCVTVVNSLFGGCNSQANSNFWCCVQGFTKHAFKKQKHANFIGGVAKIACAHGGKTRGSIHENEARGHNNM